ncbi:MAG: adenosylcobinamide-GDP ribazoletransferase, partial [Armatimonadota bacterium]|nr:adenosylcobinamide-GDP ribazoletransferase [Armatimonadota bacterium]
MPKAGKPLGWLKRLVLAGRFLTRLPIPGPAADYQELGKAAAWFPLVGWIIGALTALAGAGVAVVWDNPL